MKITICIFFTAVALAVLGQPIAEPAAELSPTNSNGGQIAADDFSTRPLPVTKADYWQWGIAIVSTGIVWAAGKIPALPRPILPVLSPLVGILLGMALRQLEAANLSWVDMGQAGALAVFLRETTNQLVTKQLKPLEASKTHTKPVDDAIAVRPEGRKPVV